MMRVLLTGGGTAGHVNPALAIAQTIRRNDPLAVIEFVGVETGKETELVPREGFRLHFVDSLGFDWSIRPSAIVKNMRAAWMALRSPSSEKTLRILREFQPDLVIGTGGHACWPLMAAASEMGIKTALHESNAKPGLAVRRLKRRVDRIWVNFEATLAKLGNPENAVRVGNPLRGDFGGFSKEEARKRLGISKDAFFLLSFGGSLGAEYVNLAVLELMKEFSSKHPNVLHLHGTGKRDYENIRSRFEVAGLHQFSQCRIEEYLYDMPLQMAAADLVISRAGAMSLSELALLKKASVLIPSPYVAANHQYLNAVSIAEKGGAALVKETKNMKPQEVKEMERALIDAVQRLYRDPDARSAMEERVAAFAMPDANRLIWEEIQLLTGKGDLQSSLAPKETTKK